METTIGVNLRVTQHSNPGEREYMEDMMSISYQQTSDGRGCRFAYFGIFDGHGGREAAVFAKTHLKNFIMAENNFWSEDDELVKIAIRNGFMATHNAMWKERGNWSETNSGYPSTSGTTASVVFIRRGKMYIGHVGDSGIVLGLKDPDLTYWLAKPLTSSHKPENPVENARIVRSGGKVMVSKYGVSRVVWGRPQLSHKGPVRRSTFIEEIPFLAIARSLGDLWSYNSVKNEFLVSPVPDVSVVDLDTTTHRCIILGSDGLWDMLSFQEAVSSVFFVEEISGNKLRSCSSQSDINSSVRLVERALDRWECRNARADNISVITIVIDPADPVKHKIHNHQAELSVTDEAAVFNQAIASVEGSNSRKNRYRCTRSHMASLPLTDNPKSSITKFPKTRKLLLPSKENSNNAAVVKLRPNRVSVSTRNSLVTSSSDGSVCVEPVRCKRPLAGSSDGPSGGGKRTKFQRSEKSTTR